MSTPAWRIGSRYSFATVRRSVPEVIPFSTNSTNCGQAALKISVSTAAANASSYALDEIVASVPITPTFLFLVDAIALLTAG